MLTARLLESFAKGEKLWQIKTLLSDLRAIGKVGQNRDNQGLSEYDIAASAQRFIKTIL